MILKALGFNPQTMKVRTELTAGLTTFLTMSYILAVNPDIMSAASMDKGAVFTATALSSAIATLIMAFLARVPFALAPGMGINAFFAFTVVQGMGYSWETALTAVFIEGLVFVLLTVFNIRQLVVHSIPQTIRLAITAGIGLFITFIGLTNCGIITSNPVTFIALGKVTPTTVLAFAGILLSGVLMAKKVKGALFYMILLATLVGIPMGITKIPEGFVPFSMPVSLAPTFLKFDFSQLGNFDMLIVIFSFIFMDLFDTLGTLVGTATKLDAVNKKGDIPYLKPALMADALGTTIGAMLGTSTVTTYMESTTGIAEGGRSGLTSVTTAFFFLLSLFFAPLFLLIPSAATTSALVIVGVLMLDAIRQIDYSDMTEALPAFVTIVMMPFAYSIAEGIVLGLLSYVVMKVLSGRYKQVSLTMYVLAVLFVLRYLLG